MLSPSSEYIDWRRFLLSAAQPWPPASKMDLLVTLERFRAAQCARAGHVGEEEFAEVRGVN